MDKEILEDFRLKVKDRLTEYLKKSNLPLDNSSPIRPPTICPCCGKKAEIITYPVEPPTINWRCTVCMEIGDAIRFAKEYYRMNTDEQAIVDICRKLGIQITTLSTFTAEELIRMGFPPLQELIEGMLAPGLYILAGASKIGKSWLVLQIAHHISTGLPTLHEKNSNMQPLDTVNRLTWRQWQDLLDRDSNREDERIFKWIGSTEYKIREAEWREFEKGLHLYLKSRDTSVFTDEELFEIYNSIYAMGAYWLKAFNQFSKDFPKSAKIKTKARRSKKYQMVCFQLSREQRFPLNDDIFCRAFEQAMV